MKLKVLIVAVCLVLFSCNDDDGTINQLKPEDKYLFDLKLNKKWILEKDGKNADFTVISFDTVSWVIDYWDTTNKVKLPTYTIEWKEFDQNLPRYTDFGLALTDSSYLFGTVKHQFVSLGYPTEFFVFMFEIPKKMPSHYIKQNESTKVVSNETLFWKQTYEIAINDTVFVNGINHKLCKIKYLAERRKPLPTIYGEEFYFAEKIGFYSFRNYLLTSVSE